MSDLYFNRLRMIKQGLLPKESGPKPKKPLKRISDKKAAEMQATKAALGEDESLKERWFSRRRNEMIGVCQCGCTRKSSKHDAKHFRSSICHIFPQRLFQSVQFHHLNWVERNFWDGCHTNMDNKSMDLWPKMADFDDIKEKFFILMPLLTDEERKKKFYLKLKALVYAN